METKILFCKHWWRICYRRYRATTARRARKTLRQAMRETAKTVLMVLKAGSETRAKQGAAHE